MKFSITILFTFIFSLSSYSQNKDVIITEVITKKRTFLYGENITDKPKSIFLKVDAIGFRRRSDRPLIELIPPKSKKLLITLIPLADVESKYTYTYVVNDEIENINVTVDKIYSK